MYKLFIPNVLEVLTKCSQTSHKAMSIILKDNKLQGYINNINIIVR